MSAAIAIIDPEPSIVTVYCVQPFWWDRRKLSAGRLRQFKQEEDAVQAGLALSLKEVGVLVFSVTGNPEADYWEEPRLLASHGEVPALST